MCGNLPCVANQQIKQHKTLAKKFVTYWFFDCKSLCYPKTWSLLHHWNCKALEQLQREDLKMHQKLKLLKKSASQWKYTAEYGFKIAKQPTQNTATSAVTCSQGKCSHRSSHRRYSMKKAVLNFFLNSHRKISEYSPVSEPLFNNFAGLEACDLIK